MSLEENLDLPIRKLLPIMQKRIMSGTFYRGVRTLKNPLDLWVYQEIVQRVRPDVIVEIGNRWGGSAYALADYCSLLGNGRVVAIDIDHSLVSAEVRSHPLIDLIESPALDSMQYVSELVGDTDVVMVIEDSSHEYEHTLEVLELFGPLVSPGSYMVVEDSICHHGLDVGPSPGPFEAIEEFIRRDPGFEIDRNCESFLVTWNPKGFLKRK